MTKILEEVRQLSSDAIARKQDIAKNKYPNLLEQIKKAAALGKTICDFAEHEIDQYSKKLLEADGFRVWATTQVVHTYEFNHNSHGKTNKIIWKVSW